jgi:hypothetical protein
MLQRRVGFSQSARATVCPVEYHLELDSTMPPGTSRCWIGTSKAEFDSARASMPGGNVDESALSHRVKSHMVGIMGAGSGSSENPLFVGIQASDLRFSGIVVDMPGIIPDPDSAAADRVATIAYSAKITTMIKNAMLNMDKDYAFVVCVDKFSVRGEDGSNFRERVLIKPTSQGGAGIDPRQIISVMCVMRVCRRSARCGHMLLALTGRDTTRSTRKSPLQTAPGKVSLKEAGSEGHSFQQHLAHVFVCVVDSDNR